MRKWTIIPVAFGLALVTIGILAGVTALGTPGPWFSPEVSAQVYETSLFGTIVLAMAVAALAFSHVNRLDEVLRTLDLRLAALPEYASLPPGKEPRPDDVRYVSPSDAEVDELLDLLLRTPPNAGGEELDVTGSLVEVSTAVTAARTRRDLLKAILEQREALVARRRRVVPLLAGPLFGCLVFALIAGAMLPGSGGFAVRNFRLNTGLVLFLGYGWAFLLAWVVGTLGLLSRSGTADRRSESARG